MINFSYCDFKVKTEDITFISLQQREELDSQRWNVTPCIMIYFTYRDLKVTTNDVIYIQFQHGREDNFSTFKFNPI